MKYLHLIFFSLLLWISGCQSKNNETTIPDASSVENLTEASLNVLNESIDDDPSNDFLYYKRALFYYHHHNYAKTLYDINKAIEIEDDKGDYYLLQGQANYADGNLVLAKESALKAESLLDNVPALMVLQSNIYLDLKDTLKYNTYISKTVSMIPFKADADFVQGRKYLIDKDSVRSLTFFQSAVKKDPDYLPAYKEIIKIYMNKSMYDSSMSYVLNGIRISHQAPLFYEAEGRFFEKVKLYGAAESAYLIALKYSDRNPEYLELLGNLKYKLNDYKKALSWYSQLLILKPGDFKLLGLCAETAYHAKEWSKASSYYGKLIEIDSNNVSYKHHYQLAVKQAYDSDSIEIAESNNSVPIIENVVVPPVAPSTSKKPVVESIKKEESPKLIRSNGVVSEELVIKKTSKVKVKDSIINKVVQQTDSSAITE